METTLFGVNLLTNSNAESGLTGWTATNTSIVAGGTSGNNMYSLVSSASLAQTATPAITVDSKQVMLRLNYKVDQSEASNAFVKLTANYKSGKNNIYTFPLNGGFTAITAGLVGGGAADFLLLQEYIDIPDGEEFASFNVAITTSTLTNPLYVDFIELKIELPNQNVSASLTNETVSVPTDAAGNNGVYTGANTTMSVTKAGVDDTANWTVTAVASSGVTGSLASKTYTVTSMSVDAGYVDLTATKTGYASITKRFNISKAKQGTSTIAGVLSNESVAVPADNTGAVTSFAGATTTMSIYNGTVDDSANWAVAVSGTPANIGGSLTGKTYTASSLTADTGYVDLVATRSGYSSVTKRFVLSKAKAGAPGAPGTPAQYAIVSGDQIFKFAAGSATPSSNTIALTVNTFGVSSPTYKWQYFNGTAWVDLAKTGYNTANYTVAYNDTEWGSSVSMRYRCLVNGSISDEISIAKIYDGATGGAGSPGAPGAGALTVIFTNETTSIPTDVNGGNGNYAGSGTDVYLYEGVNPLTYDGVGTSNGTWKIVATTQTAITAGAISVGSSPNRGVVANASAMTADTASIVFTITGKRADGTAISLTKTQTFSKAKAGAAGSPGTPGTPGANAQYVILSGDQVFKYSAGAGTPTNTTIALVATPYNITSPTYQWQYWNGTAWVNSAKAGNTTANYTVAYNDTEWGSNNTTRYRCLVSGSFTDEVTLVKLFDGATGGQGTPGTPGTPGVSALTVVLSNESFTVPTDSAGNNGNYTGSGTDIYLYEGTNQLTYDGVGTANGTWKIATAATNITASTAFTDQGTYVTVGNHSAMTADTATITYTITGKRADGTAISLTKTQTFSKAKTGATGGQGTPGTPGADAIIGILSKESAVVPTDSAGNNGNFTNVATTLTIYEGGAVSSGWTITQTRSNVTVTEATSSATATVTAISADTGSVTFTATKSGYANVVKTFTVSKSKAGTAGTPGAPAITGILNNESTSVPADNTGTVTSFTGANTTMYIFNGTTDDSANWTVAVSGTPTGIGGSLSGKTYTVTSMTADTGFVDLIATRSGYASITKRFTVTKNKQGLKGDTGSQGNTGARGPESDEALLFGKNSSFYDWAGTLPDGYSGQVGVAPTKVASDNKTSGNSVQWVVAAATNTYMQKNVINVAYSQYVSVEVTFKLTSGTIGGAGVLVRMEATTDADTYIKFVDYVPSPTLNQWYTISEVIKLPSATVPAGYTGYTIFPMGGWTSFGTVDAKTILFDAVKVRPASDGEKYGFENGLLVNGWVATGTVEINGGKVKADTITSREIYVADLSSLSANIGTITAGILKNPSGTTQLNLTTGTFNLGGSALSWNGTTLDINGNIVSDSDNGSRVLRTTIFDGGLQQDWIANDGTYSFDIVIDAWNGIFNTQYTTPAKTVIDKQINISPSLIQFYSNNVANDTSYFGTIQVKGNQTFRRANGGSTGDWIPTLFFDKIDIDMNNNYIQNVNHITFQDGGGSEGIEWLTADNWKIVQAPDDLSNPTDGSGNLQFVRQGVRKATFTSGGNLDLAGNTVSLSGTNGLVSAEAGYLVLRSVAGGIVYAQGLELRATTVNATSFTPVVCQGVITGYTNLYLQVGSTGEVIATSSDRSLWGSTITYRPVRASSFPTGSSVTWKSNVEEFSVEEANFMLDTTPVYTYHLDSNIEQGIYDKPKVGMLAEAVPQKLRDEDGVDPYSIVATLWKVVQGHKKEIAELKAQIADLQLAI